MSQPPRIAAFRSSLADGELTGAGDDRGNGRIGSLGVLAFHFVWTLQGVLPDDVDSGSFHVLRDTNLVTVST